MRSVSSNSWMVLTIRGERARRKSIVPRDSLRVAAAVDSARDGEHRLCYVRYCDEKKYVFAGTVASFDGRSSPLPSVAFEARAVDCGDGHEIKIVVTRSYLTCKRCKKHLVKIGWSRANGKDHGDWIGRPFHKNCWKLQQRE